jgi:predicted GIY-YIG superfamily endonuclease
VKFVYVKKSRGLSAARKLEAKVKRMSRDEKEQLVKGTLKP